MSGKPGQPKRRPWIALLGFVGDIPNACDHALKGSRWTEFATRVEPDDLTVVSKKRLSPFFATDLEMLLRHMQVRTVVLSGGMTDCYIIKAAFDAANRDFRVVCRVTWWQAPILRSRTPP